jgi:hypothetical protein
MKKAENINELANNLIPEDFLKQEDKEFYVPIYDEILRGLRDTIINDRVEAQTFFVAGQSGTGKTTALNFLENDELKKHYFIKYINMRNFLDERDVDIIDFLITFAFALVEDTPLEESYFKELETIRKKHQGELIGVDAGASAEGGFFNFVKLKAGFFANYKMETLYRTKTREIFKVKAPQLLKLANDLIDMYIEKVTKGKKLLVIIDDLDKLKVISQIDSIFLKNRRYIFDLKCKKVISIPTYLTTASEIFNYIQNPIPQFVLKLKPNPIEPDLTVEENETIETNKSLLEDVIKKRIAADKKLIDDAALNKAVDFSGGIIRQLVSIIRQAAVKVRMQKGEKISESDVTSAIEILRDAIARTIISSDKINLLETINKKNRPITATSGEFLEVLHANSVLAYKNGTVWYELNPLIKKTVEIYAKKQEEE